MKADLLCILTALLGWSVGLPAADSGTTFSDANWVSLGSLPGANSTIFALAVDTNAAVVYVGGAFTAIGNAAASGIAAWNGTTWSSLGAGLTPSVRALAVDGAGHLYAAGSFTNIAAGATNVARWNGSAWSALGSGLNGTVLALAADSSGHLYAGGSFTNGNLAITNIAVWQGSAWSPLGTGMTNTVISLAVSGTGVLYAGGVFTSAGGTPASRIAAWNWSAWSALGS